MINPKKKSKPSANRTAAIFLALNRARARDLDLALARAFRRADVFHDVDFDELVRSLEQLQKTQPAENTSREEKSKFIESVYSLWFTALGIDPNTVALSTEEAQSLAEYFYICELMVRCKEGATRVSPDVWESIESSILTLQSNTTTTTD
ncbi:MAG: hypothetical protein AAFZ17_09460 [Cyanobacteria bacterium J06650_10]